MKFNMQMNFGKWTLKGATSAQIREAMKEAGYNNHDQKLAVSRAVKAFKGEAQKPVHPSFPYVVVDVKSVPVKKDNPLERALNRSKYERDYSEG